MRAAWVFVSFVVSLVACGSSGSDVNLPPADGGGGGDNGGDAARCLTCALDGALGPPIDSSTPAGPTVLFAQDKDTLYQVDPTDPTLAVTQIGKFDCIGAGAAASSMTDIAVDANRNLFGVATSTLFLDMKIQSNSVVACSNGAVPLQGGDKFYGQSFAPKGTLDPNNETLLVGDSAGLLYAADTGTGALTPVGSFGDVPADDGNGNTYPSDKNGGAAGTTFQMSGDIVFLSNGGSPIGFATVRDCKSGSTCSSVDTLIELDVAKLASGNTASVRKSIRGQVRKAASCNDAKNTAYGGMYGIAAYQDRVIGFSSQGFIVSIDNTDGTACLIRDYSATIKFDGAGVTTAAPVKAPPPK
jgi:hypothetical protein